MLEARVLAVAHQRLDLARVSRVREVLDKVMLALEASVSDFAYLFRVESLPGLAVEVDVEGHDESRVHEIYKCIPDVAVVLDVYG